MDILSIQPSQLYINSNKLKQLQNISESDRFDPIPIKMLDSQVIFTDGHTRALALFMAGRDKIQVNWDGDDLDWESYRICIKWCIEEGITSISDLACRIVSSEEYEKLWIERCAKLHSRKKRLLN